MGSGRREGQQASKLKEYAENDGEIGRHPSYGCLRHPKNVCESKKMVEVTENR